MSLRQSKDGSAVFVPSACVYYELPTITPQMVIIHLLHLLLYRSKQKQQWCAPHDTTHGIPSLIFHAVLVIPASLTGHMVCGITMSAT